MTFEPCGFRCWEAQNNNCHCSCNGLNHGILRRNKELVPFKDLYPQCLINKKPYMLIDFCHALNYRKFRGNKIIIKKLTKKQIKKYKPAQELFNKGECVGERMIYGVYQEIDIQELKGGLS